MIFNVKLNIPSFLSGQARLSEQEVTQNQTKHLSASISSVLSLLSVVSKVFEKLVNNRTVDHLEKWGLFFLTSCMVLGLLDEPQFF